MKKIKANLKKRESNMELLRIIAMILIVFHHFVIHGNLQFDTTSINVNCIWSVLVAMGGKLGVNVFILISGYFLVKEKEIKFDFNHIFKFLFQVLFYSVIILFIFTIVYQKPLELITIQQALMPITFEKWWFASSYFILYLIHPFINKTLIILSKKEYKMLLLILIVFFSIIPSFVNKFIYVDNLVWFITLYCIAGYIKIYGLPKQIKCHHYFLTFIGCILFTFYLLAYETHAEVYMQNRINMLLLAITLFMTFNKLKIAPNNFINLIASATFGVYLIHDEPQVRIFLWNDLVKNNAYQDSNLFIPYSIVVCLTIYIACTIIELLRKKFVEKPVITVIENIKQRRR